MILHKITKINLVDATTLIVVITRSLLLLLKSWCRNYNQNFKKYFSVWFILWGIWFLCDWSCIWLWFFTML